MAHLNLPPTIRTLRSITTQMIIVKNICVREGDLSENDCLYYIWRYVHTHIYVATYIYTHRSNTYIYISDHIQTKRFNKLKKNPFNMQVDLTLPN